MLKAVQPVIPVLLGIILIEAALGIVGALALTRFLQSQLFGVGTRDVPVYAGVTLLLLAVAALACYLPARGTTRIDPMAALRESWQLEREGAWDPDTHGMRSYWEGLHPAVALEGDGALDPVGLREQLRSQAREYTREAMRIMER